MQSPMPAKHPKPPPSSPPLEPGAPAAAPVAANPRAGGPAWPDAGDAALCHRLMQNLWPAHFFYRHDAAGVFTYASPSVEEVLGYKPEEFRKFYGDYLPPSAINQEAHARTRESLAGQRQPPYLVECRHHNGSLRTLEVTEYPVLDATGTVTGVEGLAHDITARRTDELARENGLRSLEAMVTERTAALRDREEMFRTVANFTYDWEYWTGPDGCFVYCSPSCERVTGYPPAAFLSDLQHLERIVHPDDLPAYRERVQADTGPEHSCWEFQFRIIREDSAERWLHHVSQPVYGADGHWRGRRGSNRDITSRKVAEQALRAAERQWQATFDAIGDTICLLDAEGRILTCNHAFERLVGDVANPCGCLCHRALHHTDQPIAECPVVRMRQSKRRETSTIAREGRHLAITADPILNSSGDVVGAVHITVDVTTRVQAEQALARHREQLEDEVARRTRELREREEMYRTVADFTYDWEQWRGPDGRYLYVSQACERISGYRAEEFLADPELLQRIVYPEEQALVATHLSACDAHKKEAAELQFRIITRSGETRWIHHVCRAVFSPTGEWRGRRGSNRDITETKHAEVQERQRREELMRAEKMIAVGTLLAGIAHEISNPNQFMMLGAPSLSRMFADLQPILDAHYEHEGDFNVGGSSYADMREEIPELLRGMLEGSRRIRTIVSSLKGFTKPAETGAATAVDLNATIRDAMPLLENLIKNATDAFTLQLAPDLPHVLGHSQTLAQVIVSLVQNACQALPERRCAVTVLTAFDPLRHQVRLEVIDQGCGIPPGLVKHIIEPFFTTHRDGGGTGLGLYVVSQIVAAYEGRLEFEPGPGGVGTTVRVWLVKAEN